MIDANPPAAAIPVTEDGLRRSFVGGRRSSSHNNTPTQRGQPYRRGCKSPHSATAPPNHHPTSATTAPPSLATKVGQGSAKSIATADLEAVVLTEGAYLSPISFLLGSITGTPNVQHNLRSGRARVHTLDTGIVQQRTPTPGRIRSDQRDPVTYSQMPQLDNI